MQTVLNFPKPQPPRWSVGLSDEQMKTMLDIIHLAVQLKAEVTPFESSPVSVGPILTSYHVVPGRGTKIEKVENLAKDLAVKLGAESVSVTRYPGDSYLSIGVPNKERNYVMWRDHCIAPWTINQAIPLFLGINQRGSLIWEDLNQCPHLLIAGTTGSGKSTLVRSMITTMIMSKAQIQFELCDTKQVEFGDFKSLAHVIIYHSIPEVRKGLTTLISDMHKRLKTLATLGHKNIITAGKPWNFRVLVIDELAMLTTDDTKIDKEDSPTGKTTTVGKLLKADLLKLASLGRAVGIHIIASTQRPSVDIVDGAIKANFPARLSFRLPTRVDSSVILDQTGAEQLLMKGDMLYISPNHGGIRRLHAPYTTEADIIAALEFAVR
jgi:S-DNA-T family DNA segregation ATPase FtsK/SpoIIIE